MTNDDIAVRIINALNKAKIGYRLDVDGEMHFYTEEDKAKAETIIKNEVKEGKRGEEG